MKKLLTTTALVGMLVSSVAIAETKVTGSIEQAYNSVSVGGGGAGGSAALGQETNLKITGSKDLSNGMKLSGVINLESNDADTKNDTSSIKLTSGALSFEVGVDTGQNIHSNINPRVDDQPFDSIAGLIGKDSMVRYQAHDRQHIGVAYASPVGSFAANYAPSSTGADAAAGSVADGGGSALEISFSGNLGVKGLKVLIGQETIEANDGSVTTAGTLEEKEKVLSFSYGQGPYAVGYTHRTFDDGNGVATNSIDKVTAISATYAISDNLSIGYERLTGEFESSAKHDEETDAITVGYNLGGLGVSFMYVEADNVAGGTTAADDQESFQIRTVYSF